MFKTKTLIELMEDSGKAKVNMRLANRLSGGLDDESKQTVEELLSRMNDKGNDLFSELENFCLMVIESVTDRGNELTGQDISEYLLSIDSALIETDVAMSTLKTELDFLDMAFKDEYNKFYMQQFDGTINDRTSFAESKTVKERYTLFVKRAFYDSLVSRRDAVMRVYKSLERWAWRIMQSNK